MIKLKMGFVLLLSALLAFTSCSDDNDDPKPYTPSICDDDNYILEFSDANLENALLEALGKEKGDFITCADAKMAINLDLQAKGIKNLNGIEYFVNLDTLNLALNPITDYRLADSLYLSSFFKDYEDSYVVTFNDVLVESALRNSLTSGEGAVEVPENEPLTYGLLKNLKGLGISGKPKRGKFLNGDLDGLQFCTSLDSLFISVSENENYSADRVDLKPLRNLVSLTHLYLKGFDFSEKGLENLEGLTNVSILEIVVSLFFNQENGNTADLSPLSNMVKVKILNLYGTACSFVDLTPLSTMMDIEKISLVYARNVDENLDAVPVDISFLTGKTKLTDCNFSYAGIQNLTPLADCTELRRLLLHACPLDNSTLSVLKDKERLGNLGISACKITNEGLASLMNGANLPSLVKLGLSLNLELTDLSPLKSANLLMLQSQNTSEEQSSISLDRTGVTDLSSLSELLTLEKLTITNTPITSLAGLENIPLKVLDARDSELEDLSALSNNSTMLELLVSGTKITELMSLYNMIDLEQLHIARTAVPYAEIVAFKAKIPDCSVVR